MKTINITVLFLSQRTNSNGLYHNFSFKKPSATSKLVNSERVRIQTIYCTCVLSLKKNIERILRIYNPCMCSYIQNKEREKVKKKTCTDQVIREDSSREMFNTIFK